LKEGEIIVNGYVTPTDKPGLGVEMEEEVAKRPRYRKQRGSKQRGEHIA